MKKNLDLLRQKTKILETQLRQKEKLIKKYQKSLDSSNLRIKRIAEDLKKSLSLIREIHKNLLPVRLPEIPGFEFSYKFLPTRQGVSGDFFDVVKIKDSMSFGVLLSSCSTYAITSLFLSSFLKASPHLRKYKTAKDFLSFVAKKLSPSLEKKEKIHLFYGLISRSSFEMDYCLTGDIFVGHRTQKEVNILPSCSSHLYEKKDLKGGKLTLQAKDTLLICSPGIAERTNKKRQSFGRENIIKAFSKTRSSGVLETRQNILFSCNEFGKDEPLLRDCTVLAIRARNRILKIHKSS